MPDEDEGQKPNEQQPNDLDKLRSEYDTQVASLNKELEALRGQISELKTAGQSEGDLAAIQAELDGIDESDPEKAVEAVKGLALKYGKAFVGARLRTAGVENLYKQSLAEKYAIEIAHEAGGDSKTYAKELMTATTDAAMAEKAQLLKDKVALNNAKNGGNARGANNAESQDRNFRVDDGHGRPVRTDVVNQIKDFDPWSPEGQAEWAKQERELKRKVDASSGRR